MDILGVDIGTTGVKAVLVGSDGAIIASAVRSHVLRTPRPGWAELDARLIWSATRSVIRDVCRSRPPVAIGISGPGEAFVPLDTRGRPVGPILVSFDARTLDIYRQVLADAGAAFFRSRTGQEPLPHYALFKWIWWLTQGRDDTAPIARFATLSGWIAERLGAGPGIDPTLAARTLAFDPVARDWSQQVLTRVGIDPTMVPPLIDGESAGTVRSGMAGLGLQPSTPIMLAGLDQSAAAASIDFRPTDAMLSIGTTAVVARRIDVGFERIGVPWVPATRRRRALAIAGSPGGAACLRWVGTITRSGGRSTTWDRSIADACEHPTDVMFVPHLGGSRIAFDDPAAHGAFLDMTFATDRRDLLRAVLDGVALEVARLVDRLDSLGDPIDHLLAVGGASRSDGWMRIVADVTGRPVLSTRSRFAAAYGAARAAAEEIGATMPSLPTHTRFEPRTDASSRRAAMARYVEAHAMLRRLRHGSGPTRAAAAATQQGIA